MSNTSTYESPLSSRYASDEMLRLFSADKKFSTWRRLWVALARGEMELGLPVTAEQVAELEAHLDDINYDSAAQWEKKLRHDVMAHVHTYGEAPPVVMSATIPTSSLCGRASDSSGISWCVCWRFWPIFPTSINPFRPLVLLTFSLHSLSPWENGPPSG